MLGILDVGGCVLCFVCLLSFCAFGVLRDGWSSSHLFKLPRLRFGHPCHSEVTLSVVGKCLVRTALALTSDASSIAASIEPNASRFHAFVGGIAFRLLL